MTNVKKIFNIKEQRQVFSQPQKQSSEAVEDYSVKKVIHTKEGTIEKTPVDNSDIANKKYVDDNSGAAPEGTSVKSTGEGGGTKFLREDGDGTCSWQTAAGGGDVTAAVNLTNETLVQGDGGAKGVKTTTVTAAEVADNTTHRGVTTGNPHTVLLNELGNPAGDKDFNMTTRQIGFTWANPAGSPMSLEASGAYSGSVLHIEQNTGNPGAGTHLLSLTSTDTDVHHVLATGPLATTPIYCALVTGDATERYEAFADGKLNWGNGTDALDVNLYRSAANILKTDDALYVVGNITTDGTVDGIDIATDVAANTTHKGSDGSDHSKVTANETAIALNTTHRGSDGSDHSKVGANETAIALNTTHRSSNGQNHADVVSNNTHRADNSQAHSDYLINNGNDTTSGTITAAGFTTTGVTLTGDHGTATTDQVVNVCYGTSATPPAANTTTIGALYVQYTA